MRPAPPPMSENIKKLYRHFLARYLSTTIFRILVSKIQRVQFEPPIRVRIRVTVFGIRENE